MFFQLVFSLWFFAPFHLCHSCWTLFCFSQFFTPLLAFLYLLPLLYPFFLPIYLLFILFSLSFVHYVISPQILVHLTFPCGFTRSAQNFQMYRRHLKILGTRRATLSRFRSEDSQMLRHQHTTHRCRGHLPPEICAPLVLLSSVSLLAVLIQFFIYSCHARTYIYFPRFIFSLSLVTFQVTCLLFLYFLSCISYVPIFSSSKHHFITLCHFSYFPTFCVFRILFCNFVSFLPYFPSR